MSDAGNEIERADQTIQATDGKHAERKTEQPEAAHSSTLVLPDKVTLLWMAHHVPIQFWLWFLALLTAAFSAGVCVGQVPWVRELIGRAAQVSTEPVVVKQESALQHRQERRDLIRSWREMIVDIAGQYPEGKRATEDDVCASIQRHPGYQTLKPFLSNETLADIHSPRTFVAGSKIPSVLALIQADVDRLEREWALLPQPLNAPRSPATAQP